MKVCTRRLALTFLISASPWFAASAFGCEEKVNSWPYNVETGNETAGVFFSAEFRVDRNCQRLAALGESLAGGRLFDLEANLIEAKAEASLSNRRNFNVNSDLTVLGNTVNLFSYNERLELVFSDRYVVPVDLGDDTTVMVGPVPVKVEYGISADLGASYRLSLAVIEAAFNTRPFIESDVYASAGVDVGIAFVRTSGELLLLDDELNIDTVINLDQVDFDRVDLAINADNDMNALDGRIDVEAGVDVGVYKKEGERNLISWDGYSRRDLVLSYYDSFQLF